MHNFKNLTIWQKSIRLSIDLCKFVKTLSLRDQVTFSNQISKCSISIPSNIAEGSGKGTIKDFNNFLNISIGSSFELETQLIILGEVIPARKIEIEKLINDVVEIQRMIYGFKKTLIPKSESKANKIILLLTIIGSILVLIS